MTYPADRYTKIAIFFHWLIALLIVGQLGTGIVMGYHLAPKQVLFPLFQFHKSLGLTILVLSLLRLFWRLGHRPPPLPLSMPAWEKISARLSHYLFYVFMLAVPMTGWAIVSSSPMDFPTKYFGLFEWPHLPGMNALSDDGRDAANHWSEASHVYMAYALLALLVVHVAAALKHQFLDRDEVMHHMIPVIKPRTRHLPALLFLAILSASTPAHAATWEIDPAKSSIAFSGENAGQKFDGVFEKFSAEIDFDAGHPDAAKIHVVIPVASAKTGTSSFDETLPKKEWFDANTFPQAVFESHAVTRTLGNDKPGIENYIAHGTLTIRGVTKNIDLPFSLEKEGLRTHMFAETKVKRLDYGIGKKADGNAEWVSNDIALRIDLDAAQK